MWNTYFGSPLGARLEESQQDNNSMKQGRGYWHRGPVKRLLQQFISKVTALVSGRHVTDWRGRHTTDWKTSITKDRIFFFFFPPVRLNCSCVPHHIKHCTMLLIHI